MEIKTIDTLDQAIDLASENKLVGFYKIPDEVYYHPDCPGLSKSKLNPICVSPKWFLIKNMMEKKETDALRFGKMFHMYFLEPEKFNSIYEKMPSVFKGPRGGVLTGDKKREAIVNWEIEKGKKGLSEDDYLMMEAMAKSLNRNKAFNTIFPSYNRHCEIAVFAKCVYTGELLKCEMDLITQVREDKFVIGDLKTVQPLSLASEKSITRMIIDGIEPSDRGLNSRWYFQAAYYRYIMECLGYESEWVFPFIEKGQPYGVAVRRLTEEWYFYGLADVIRDLKLYSHCNKNNSWSSYKAFADLEFPSYIKIDDDRWNIIKKHNRRFGK